MTERVVVTGQAGYIGSVLCNVLGSHAVLGLDTGFYEGSGHFDIRFHLDGWPLGTEFISENNVSVIHLAALSNDPLGALDERLTYAINYEATVRLAKMAKEAGVKRFIFASSQSIYGISDGDEPLTEDAQKNPLTAYAKSKWLAEQAIMELADADFCVVALRPATVFGWSPRLRTDIVFNNMLAQAYTTGKIEVRGDGSEWRPVVHIRDLCSAFILCLQADASVVNRKAYNVTGQNHRVSEIAEWAAEAWPATITFGERAPDTRSYKTDGDLIRNDLRFADYPISLRKGGLEMVQKFTETNFTAEDMGRKTNRLAQLQWLRETGKLDGELRWR